MSETLRPQPYVGISGVGHINEHVAIVDLALHEKLLNDEHFVMVGIQATTKTQIVGIENKRGRAWHPVGEDIGLAAGNEDSGLTRPYVHCYFEDEDRLAVGLETVLMRTRHYLQGVQLNLLPWMDVDFRPIIHDLKRESPNLGIVLEVHADILERYSPQQVAVRLGQMSVDYALFDASHGFGKELDKEHVRPYINELYQRQLPIGAVVAGGLEAETLEDLFAPLVAEFDDLSCDAESRLRSGAEGASRLDMEKVAAYLHAWRQIQTREV